MCFLFQSSIEKIAFVSFSIIICSTRCKHLLISILLSNELFNLESKLTSKFYSQISVQRLGTRVAFRQNLAGNLRRTRLSFFQGSLHHPRFVASWSRRTNHQRRRAVPPMAEARRRISWSCQHQEQSRDQRRPMCPGMVQRRLWFGDWQQPVRHLGSRELSKHKIMIGNFCDVKKPLCV